MDLYDVLEVSHRASEEVIKNAYKALAKKYHPDLFTGRDKTEAEEKMKEINHAFEILIDPKKRQKYDESLKKESFKSYRTDDKEYSSYTRYSKSERNPSDSDNYKASYSSKQNENKYSHKASNNEKSYSEDHNKNYYQDDYENDNTLSQGNMEYIGCGIVWIILGLIFARATFILPSDSRAYIIFLGAILWGTINFLRGIMSIIENEGELANKTGKYSTPRWFIPINILLILITIILATQIINQ